MARRKQQKRAKLLCSTCPKAQSPAGLPLTIPFGIPANWSPQEALAIFELIDDLRDKILAIYQADLQDLMREQRQSEPVTPIGMSDEDLPF